MSGAVWVVQWHCAALLPFGYHPAGEFPALKAWVGILLWGEKLRHGKELSHYLGEVLHV